jgi:hypothetical protein
MAGQIARGRIAWVVGPASDFVIYNRGARGQPGRKLSGR